MAETALAGSGRSPTSAVPATPGDAHTLCLDMASTITLANRTLPHADRIDRRRLMDARDRLTRYHDALTKEMQHPVEGPFGTVGCWQTREPGIRDIIRDVERIAGQSCERRMVA